MKKTYRLVKLRVETVRDLHRLKRQMAEQSLDALVVSMIQMTDSRRLILMNSGWIDTGDVIDR